MTLVRFVPALAFIVIASPLHSQSPLRAAASGRATSEVVLSVPTGRGMAGMPMGGAAAAAPATPMAAATPAPKPTVIRLDYGQPHLRGRAINTDSLVPFDRPWRLGANANTTLTTDVDLVLGGATIAKGTYVLYAIPGRGEWTLVVQRSIGQSAMQYADSADVARIPLRHTSLVSPVESLTMWLIPSLDAGPARGELRFAWGTSQLSTGWSIK